MVWVRWHCRTPHLWCIKYHTITLTSCKASRLLVAWERWHGGNWQINVATSGICNILIATYTYIYLWFDHMYLYTGKKGAIFRQIWKTLSWRRRAAPTSCKEKTHLKAKKGTSGDPLFDVQKIWAAQTVDKRWSPRMSKTTSSFHTKNLGVFFKLLSAYWLICLLCVSLKKNVAAHSYRGKSAYNLWELGFLVTS